jgi:hypothetical protein
MSEKAAPTDGTIVGPSFVSAGVGLVEVVGVSLDVVIPLLLLLLFTGLVEKGVIVEPGVSMFK